MIAREDTLIDGIERRGRVYYMRRRVPAEFAEIESRNEINVSLKTRDYDEARVIYAIQKKKQEAEWRGLLAQRHGQETPDTFDAMVAILRESSLPYLPMDTLLAGPVEALLDRIERLDSIPTRAAQIPATLGTLAYPSVLISEMPEIIEEINQLTTSPMNNRQLRAWRNKYLHAARSFMDVVEDKPVLDICEEDALQFRKHWKTRYESGDITANHAVKRLRFLRQLIDAYFERFDVLPSKRVNPFKDLRIDSRATDQNDKQRKLALPVPWIKTRIIDQQGLEGLNQQARDIAIVAADCGSRQTEIFDLPPGDIHLDHEIPHIMLKHVARGEFRRVLKNKASKRPIILLGASLDAMRRNPNGFPAYRGKATYPGTVNKHLRDNNLFPEVPEGQTGRYSIGCTRHTFEDRMIHAKMSNEERAYLMGHSIGKIRGRPVYGSGPDLRMRALYQEMVAFSTERWRPRSISVLRREVEVLAEAMGFRIM